jgi:D-alanine-D-alanine ligase
MKKCRIIALTHEDLVPPENPRETTDLSQVEWKTEFDVVSTLRDLGHEVRVVGVRNDLGVIGEAVNDFKPHIAFNLLEEFGGVGVFDQNVVAYLELLRLPYTGCNPRGLILARDKGLARQIMAYHRIPFPAFKVFPIGRKIRVREANFPLIVKSVSQEASLGISQASVVETEEKLRERIAFVHESIGTDAIVEQYIQGRELYVGLIGNTRLKVLPVWELELNGMPDELRRIATARVKWSSKYQEKYAIKSGPARDLADGLIKQIQWMAKRVFRALNLSGYARIDLRLDANGRLYVLEANPNPQISYGEDFAESAETAGISYEALMQSLISLGLSWKPDRLG